MNIKGEKEIKTRQFQLYNARTACFATDFL